MRSLTRLLFLAMGLSLSLLYINIGETETTVKASTATISMVHLIDTKSPIATASPSPLPTTLPEIGYPTTTEELQRIILDNGQPKQEWKLATIQWKDYPFTIQEFEHAYSAGNESTCGFAGIRQRLDLGEPITIAIYGSSITVGRYCVTLDQRAEQRCAWPVRVQSWFTKNRPQWNLTFINLSRGGYGSERWAGETRPDVADAYILDYMANHSPHESTRDFIDMLRGPKLAVAFPISCAEHVAFCTKMCQDEPLLRIPNLAGVKRRFSGETRFDNNSADTFACPKHWDKINEQISFLGERYSLANFQDLIWRERDKITRSNDFSHIWNGRIHPDTVGHDFASHLITYALLRDLYAKVEPCVIPAKRKSFCETPNTMYDAFDTGGRSGDLLPSTNRGWNFTEDSPGKPGWIATSYGPENELSFLVNVTMSLQLTYLQSYAGVHPVFVHLPGCKAGIELNPLTGRSSSEETIVKYSNRKFHSHKLHTCFTPSPHTNVTIRAPLGKFKLTRVIGC